VNPEKIKYMLMSCNQTAGQKHRIKIVERFFEDVAKFKYLGTTLTDQICMNKENACLGNARGMLATIWFTESFLFWPAV
jgi:hypothetical protein